MAHADPWRKRKNGAEYGSYYGYAGGQIVNLGTQAYDDAKKKLRELLGLPPETAHANGAPPSSVPPPNGQPSFLHTWAGRKSTGGDGIETDAPPPPISPAVEALADGFAHAVTNFNAVALSLSVRHFAGIKPPKPDPERMEQLEKTWATGIRELIALSGLQWWHILIVQNGSLAMDMIQNGEKLPPKLNAPVEVTTVPAA
jgi:hypothetical protein